MDENILEETAYEERAADLAAEVDFYADADIDLDDEDDDPDDYLSESEYRDYLAERQAAYDDEWGDPLDMSGYGTY